MTTLHKKCLVQIGGKQLRKTQQLDLTQLTPTRFLTLCTLQNSYKFVEMLSDLMTAPLRWFITSTAHSLVQAVGPAYAKVHKEFGVLYSGLDGDPNIPHRSALLSKNIESSMRDFEKGQEALLKQIDSYIKSLQVQPKVSLILTDERQSRMKSKPKTSYLCQ